jgi:hypothetical protein
MQSRATQAINKLDPTLRGRDFQAVTKVLITLRVMELSIVHSRVIPSATETQLHHAERDDYFVVVIFGRGGVFMPSPK